MYFMFGDEADKDQTSGKKYFVYGAIFAPSEHLAKLHTEVEKARLAAGYSATDSLKSSSNSRPQGVTPEKHRELKNTIMRLANEAGKISFCAQVTLHELACNQEHDDRVLWGANTILSKFNTFLKDKNAFGFVVLDRIPVKTPYDYLKEKFQIGMVFPDKRTARLENILGLSHSADGTSHLCSVADILLGAFRYCVNEPDNEDAGKAMFPTLMQMMWKRQTGDKTYVNECGLVFRPKDVKEAKHQAEYDALSERLQSYLK